MTNPSIKESTPEPKLFGALTDLDRVRTVASIGAYAAFLRQSIIDVKTGRPVPYDQFEGVPLGIRALLRGAIQEQPHGTLIEPRSPSEASVPFVSLCEVAAIGCFEIAYDISIGVNYCQALALMELLQALGIEICRALVKEQILVQLPCSQCTREGSVRMSPHHVSGWNCEICAAGPN